MKVALITNMPVPYRIPVYSKVTNVSLKVFFCTDKETNRKWILKNLDFEHEFLKKSFKGNKDGYNFTHNNPDIWSKLNSYNPDTVITTGFNPTHLYAFVWTLLKRKKHICMTDGTIYTESSLSFVHKIIRKFVFRYTSAFIAASESGISLYKSYGICKDKIFKSELCIDNYIYNRLSNSINRQYDVCFSGQIQDRKSPLFFASVCNEIMNIRGSCTALILGDGPLKDELLTQLEKDNISYHYPGFVQQEKLPSYYSDTKLLLFPTTLDAWGVVVNEAMAAGTPVITTNFSGAANEVVINNHTGYVLDLSVHDWASSAVSILDDRKKWMSLSNECKKKISSYNYNSAANGIEHACLFAAE
ncbi:glycosyltransferase family 4 protein [Cobetia marina]|uniref:glycosyltransferase family 4 protein n=1 Tax=Cobetia marina TaxID=28258 RepID=UPI00174D028A